MEPHAGIKVRLAIQGFITSKIALIENGFVCECAPGFRGTYCQYMVDHCAISPCRNNATCVNKGPRYECNCRLGFDGVHCEHNIDECETLSRCNSKGTELCQDLINGFSCHCRCVSRANSLASCP